MHFDGDHTVVDARTSLLSSTVKMLSYLSLPLTRQHPIQNQEIKRMVLIMLVILDDVD